MRSSGGVYQPTTTSIGMQDKSWSTPRFLGPSGTTTGRRSFPRSMVFLLAGLFAIMGLIMIIVGASWYQTLTSVEDQERENSNKTVTASPEDTSKQSPPSVVPYVTILIVGILLLVVAAVGVFAYYRNLGMGLPCCPGKIAQIRQRFNSQSKFTSGAPMCAQYCPPSATSPSPPLSGSPSSPSSTYTQTVNSDSTEPPFADISEQQRLMSDDTERMMDDDPRIVLSPLKSQEEC